MYCPNCENRIEEDEEFCSECGAEVRVKEENKHSPGRQRQIRIKKIKVLSVFVGILVMVVVVVVVYILAQESDDPTPIITNTETNTNTNQSRDTAEIAAAVVSIFCPLADDEENGYSGSGTIITEDGFIITNSHVIPQDGDYLDVPDWGCLVTLPDPATGLPDEIYYGDPIVIPGISDEYDLAYIEIYDVYVDEDGYAYGQYPNVFPTQDDSVCSDELLKLGEEIRIFGYPTGGNYNLTVTDGVVSSFTEDGYILTSAKIDEGNSGGLAVDKDGCSIGIPSAVSLGTYENLGVIISAEILEQFADELNAYLSDI
ncbi:MAG: trypsin-like peptidase domain-containing protein [Patescibacteria group bacterium]